MRRLVNDWSCCRLVLVACLSLVAAGADARPQGPPPVGASRLHGVEHIHKRITADERTPNVDPALLRQLPAPAAQMQTLLACNTGAFASASGSALVTLVKGSAFECLYALFDVSGALAGQIFNEGKMNTVATALTTNALTYPGNNNTQTLQLILFLRAGYYVHYYYPQSVGNYGELLRVSTRLAMTTFIANLHFMDTTDAHGEVLLEFVTLIDNAEEYAQHLGTFKRLLDGFNNNALASPPMREAANRVFVNLYRGSFNSAFIAAAQLDSSIIDSLDNFGVRNDHLLGTSLQFLTINAAREMSRFLKYPGTLQNKARPKVKALLTNHSMVGPTAGVWLAAAEFVEAYDGANCAYYGTCNYRRDVEQALFQFTHTCSATLRMRAQDMTTAQFTQSCDQLALQETYFHDTLKTNRVPVANDNNTSLEMVIFDSSKDYEMYAGVLFGISTNNGGIYMEGNPAAPNNQARFFAYEAEWVRPTFEIWNLRHEYVHYLDGRFNLKGDFGESYYWSTTWWSEGLAEYISKKRDNAAAVQVGRSKSYQLSQIFRNTLDSGSERVYSWGYLAARFMFERHASQVDLFAGHFRAGNYNTYYNSLGGLGTSYDAEFHQWIDCVATASNPSTCASSP